MRGPVKLSPSVRQELLSELIDLSHVCPDDLLPGRFGEVCVTSRFRAGIYWSL